MSWSGFWSKRSSGGEGDAKFQHTVGHAPERDGERMLPAPQGLAHMPGAVRMASWNVRQRRLPASSSSHARQGPDGRGLRAAASRARAA
ncbi:hypothetical protein [Streptomyces xanthophaeus]|uniref:hypothetical protein n=1 Tax=Streptomyces xanthophaeus TaxID=67385 RepID=UPI002649D15B|nr:hypothetical protein [Streptomyces xanthophaeus]WKD31252.1 hypothetical protein KO717_04275 [Streptomyces xanthophaeus]